MNDQPSSRPPLPAVDRVLAADAARLALERFGRAATLASVRARLDEARAAWR
ncbi:L-seryl-tRNA(Sec) selenium transferase, partial [Methylopila musalis]